MDGKTFIAKAIKLANGSQAELARRTGLSQPLINKAVKSGRAGPKLALAIHYFSKGDLPASMIRPDLWRRPEDVPPSPTSAPEGAAV